MLMGSGVIYGTEEGRSKWGEYGLEQGLSRFPLASFLAAVTGTGPPVSTFSLGLWVESGRLLGCGGAHL